MYIYILLESRYENQNSAFSSLNGKPLKLADEYIYLGNNISSTESDGNICIGKAGTTIDRLSSIKKSDLSNKKKNGHSS